MPSLKWIGKDKVINYHQKVPYRVLERQYSFDKNGQHKEDNCSQNMIIHGDNLEALKSLLPRYEGKVKCIYIDPPYNTGNENWVYNDNVSDQRIRKWLGEVVGKEGEDLSRHDKWLCMMYPRLKLLQKLLTEDGVIFISIDDNELYNLKAICDEIFGQDNFLVNVIWQNSIQPKGYLGSFSVQHNYTLVYEKTSSFRLGSLQRTEEHNKAYKNPDNDPNGKWRSGDVRNALYRPNLIYDIITPSGKAIKPPANGWRWSQETIQQKIQTGEIIFNKDETKIIRKIYLNTVSGRAPESIWFGSDVGTTREANSELKMMFDGHVPFDTPKPIGLIERIIQIASDSNSIILDSFAGSGTTAHAVLNMNKKDGGNRKFILVEMDDYADSITAERVKRVIKGYSSDRKDTVFDKKITASNLVNGAEILNEAKTAAAEARDQYDTVSRPKMINGDLQVIGIKKASREVKGTGGSFSYYELGEPLLLENHMLNESVSTDKIREYVYYMETRQPIDTTSSDEPYWLGEKDGITYYFYYEKQKITSLDYTFLKTLRSKSANRIIYADCCLLSDEELQRYNITFKKIPRDISRL